VTATARGVFFLMALRACGGYNLGTGKRLKPESIPTSGVVVVANGIPASVSSTMVWVYEWGMDVTLVQGVRRPQSDPMQRATRSRLNENLDNLASGGVWLQPTLRKVVKLGKI
jgi:hypothetical protein